MLLNKIMFRNLPCQFKWISSEVIIVVVLKPGRLYISDAKLDQIVEKFVESRVLLKAWFAFSSNFIVLKICFQKKAYFLSESPLYPPPSKKETLDKKTCNSVGSFWERPADLTLLFLFCFQWRIAHFPEGPSISDGIAPTYYLKIVCQKLHEN